MDVGTPCYDILLAKSPYILQLIPFNSGRKRACTAIQRPQNQIAVRVFCKGGPEVVFKYVSKMFNKNGDVININEEDKERIMKQIISETFAVKAYRTLLVAYREYSMDEYERLKDENNGFSSESDREALENDLTLVGIYALQDPLRDEIIPSVEICHRAGVNVRMVTGDNLDTAKAIALEAGILDPRNANLEYACMDGKTFREACGGLRKIETGNDLLKEEIVNKDIFKIIAKRLQVLGRSTPEDKYMLVTGLRDLGAVVAVTGDGTNDAPALKKADVGFAMGITGTEVAKEAADIILLDDNFASIVTAIKWGRNIYSNVRKFLQFQLVINIVAIVLMIVSSIALPPNAPPLNTVEMLWVNLLMDTFAALALATEDPNVKLLNMQPYSKAESIITPVMWRNIIGQTVYQLVVVLTILFGGQSIGGYEYDFNDELVQNG